MVNGEREVGEAVAGSEAGAGGFESGALHGGAVDIADDAEDDGSFACDHRGGLADSAFMVAFRCFEGVHIEGDEVGCGVDLGMVVWA